MVSPKDFPANDLDATGAERRLRMRTLIDIALDILAVFSLTTLWTTGEIFSHWRGLAQGAYQKAADLPPLSWLRVDPEYQAASCAMCVGFWVTVFVVLVPIPAVITMILAIHGASYWLRAHA
jgi:hypothetical protein